MVTLLFSFPSCSSKRFTACDADSDCADSASAQVVCAAPTDDETGVTGRAGRPPDTFCATRCTDACTASGESCVPAKTRAGASASICVREPLLIKYPFFSARGLEFNRSALAAALLVALICGFLGVYVVLKKIVFVSASLSQIASLGVAIAFSIPALSGSDSPSGRHLHPLEISLAFTVAGAIFFSSVRPNRRLSPDALMGIAYIVASAAVVLLGQYMSQAEHDIKEILFGNPIAIETEALEVLAITAGAVLLLHIYFFKMFVFASFDAEMMGTLGLRPRIWDIILFSTIGVVIAVASRAIGSMNVFAFMVVPPAAALLATNRLKLAFALSVVFALAGAFFGHYFSWTYDLPPGPTMVVAATAFLAVGGLRRLVWRR
ncbi:MAG: metal ABC transporter permease [Deltaproteobacteria bacterium]|nr:metal ABC transporter permease [Deltaproteobacteria bacterium]